MTEEVPPSASLIRSLLELQPDAVLVGGQSLAAWAQHYALAPLPPLVPVFSKDIDFLARAAVADEIGKKLGGKVFHPSPDDHVQINTAVVSLPQGSDYVRVDFLAVVVGGANPPLHGEAPLSGCVNDKGPVKTLCGLV